MKTFSLYTHYKKILADTITPVSIYLKIRDKFPNSILLESSDYHANDNSFSYICCNPIASIKIKDEAITQTFPDGTVFKNKIKKTTSVTKVIHKFTKRFKVQSEENFKFINNGIFGYIAYDAVRYFEDVEISKKEDHLNIPDIYYAVYQNIIAINHFKNHGFITGDLVQYTPSSGDANHAPVGLGVTTRYRVLKLNNDKFQLIDVGVGAADTTSNYLRKNYVRISDVSTLSNHEFSFEPIVINILISIIGIIINNRKITIALYQFFRPLCFFLFYFQILSIFCKH